MFSKRLLTQSLLFAALTAGVAAAFTACSDDNSGSVVSNGNYLDADSTVTTDQLGVVYTGKTLLLGDDRTNLNGAVAARIMNPTTEASADLKAVVFTKGSNLNISLAAAKSVIRAYSNDAPIVVLDPESFGKSTVIDSLKKAITELDGTDKDIDDRNRLVGNLINTCPSEPDKKILGAVAYQKHFTYVSNDESEDSSNRTGETTEVNENGDTVKTQYPIDDAVPNAYNYGVSADNLIMWIKDAESLDDGTNAELDENGINVVSIYGTVGPTPAFEKKLQYNLKYKIIPLFSPDNNSDYYLVQLNAKFYNSMLNCTKSTEWKAIDHDVYIGNGEKIGPSYITHDRGGYEHHNYWEGPYLRGTYFKMDVLPSDQSGEVISIYDAKPVAEPNPVVGLDFSSEFVNFLTPQMSTNPYGQPFSYHNSQTLSDNEALIATYLETNKGGSAVDWNYAGSQIGYSDVKSFQRNDWSTDLSWIVQVKNPKVGHRYVLSTNIRPVLEEACYDYCYTYVATRGDNTYTLDLPQPIRCKKSYLMKMQRTDNLSTDNANSMWVIGNDNAIKENVGVSYKNGFYSYNYTQADAEKAAIAKFKQYMMALQEIAVKEGSTRNMTFTLVCNDKDADTVAKCTLNGTELTFIDE